MLMSTCWGYPGSATCAEGFHFRCSCQDSLRVRQPGYRKLTRSSESVGFMKLKKKKIQYIIKENDNTTHTNNTLISWFLWDCKWNP